MEICCVSFDKIILFTRYYKDDKVTNSDSVLHAACTKKIEADIKDFGRTVYAVDSALKT
jgi:hypothetical protein